jgi:hypothetical protein
LQRFHEVLAQGVTVELACREIGISAPTYYKWRQRYEGMSIDDAKDLKCETPADPDRWLRAHLCKWVGISRNAHKGYRRARADLRAGGHVVDRRCVQRLWREEGLRVARKPRRKRAGSSTSPITTADAPNVVWAIDFQFDSLRCGTPVKKASKPDERGPAHNPVAPQKPTPV